MVVPRWHHVFSRVHATQGISNMAVPNWNYVPHRRVDIMVVPSSSHVFLRVQATQGAVSNMVVPSWNHVFSRVQATQVGI